MRVHLSKPIRLGVLLLAALLLVGVPADAAVYILCAKPGTINLPGLPNVPIWGFAQGTVAAPCGGTATLPGPVLSANGEVVFITLHNALDVPVSLMIPGQNVLRLGGTAFGGTEDSFSQPVGPGQWAMYTFVSKTGTYIYESGIDTARQVAMGLHGALRVGPRPGGPAYPPGPGNPNTVYNSEAVLVLSEIDPNLNANPLAFNMQGYAPTYWLINGEAYPDTNPIPAPASPPREARRLLLRYVNASFNHHAMSLRGLHQLLIAREAFRLPTAINVVSETIPAGTTADAIVVIPGGSSGRQYPLYNRNMRLTNGSDNAPGGMRTRVQVP